MDPHIIECYQLQCRAEAQEVVTKSFVDYRKIAYKQCLGF